MNAFANWLDNDAHFIGFLVTACAVGAGLVWVFKRFKSEPPSLSSRGEESGVPEERDDEMAVPIDPSDRRAVAAMFGEYAREMADLRQLAREIEDLYVIEVER
jgi:hypothetical protein